MLHHSAVSSVGKLSHTLFFGMALCGWTTVGKSAEWSFPVNVPGIGAVLSVDM